MSAERNTQIVKDAYAAFLRGDVEGIVGLVTDDVEWEGVKGTEGVLPQSGVRRGKDGVRLFFAQVNDTIAFERFELKQYIASDAAVVALGYYAGKAKATGNSMGSDWVMVFEFRDGRIARFREFTDSAAVVRAFGRSSVAAS